MISRSAEDYAELIIAHNDGRVFKLSDVAEIIEGAETTA